MNIPPILEIDGVLVSSDILTERFCCDYAKCKGICCVEGDAGAPVTLDEIGEIEQSVDQIWNDLSASAQSVIDQQGVAYTDREGDLVTSIVGGKDCVFTCYADMELDGKKVSNCCLCALEKAYRAGKTRFCKPISCALYPIREKRFSNNLVGLNYNRWTVCKDAVALGKQLDMPLYRFLAEPLKRRFGEGWYKELCEVADMMKRTLLVLVCLFSLLNVHAQSRQHTWTITPRVGVNSSDVRGQRWYLYEDDEETITKDTPTRDMATGRKWDFTVGFDVEGLITRRFGLSAGVFFSDEGYRNKDEGGGTVHLRMISVPILANYYVLPGLAVKGGVQMSGLIDGQIHYGETSQSILNSTKTFSVGIPVGASFDYRNVSLDMRYVIGITDLCDVRKINRVGDHWYTNSIWITLGYRINL